ncbi:MAG: HlyD family efflux transporter periplasmic adaptor subunit [Verrucomicrobia bacterium]|jgi:multidrug resistance efflux pump|nr:HlyD family efflux transporter periplasmic adaptor subunit [Verrucomicrobiota bacterium]MDB4796809.1 HlyD family efflux transporter periplasmic adaptor subunit [bacterium]
MAPTHPHSESPKASRVPSTLETLIVLVRGDLGSCARSWLVRGFLVISTLVSILAMKGMQSDQAVASRMLETLYATYILIWMHGVIFIAGSALLREQDCLSDAILSRGITRGEYIGAKLFSRCLTTLILLGCVILPTSFWAIRQDQLVRTETGYLSANAQGVAVDAWEPKKVFTAVEGPILEMNLEVGDEVHVGDVLALIDDRILHDSLETERRSEQNARNEIDNSHRRYENAKRAVSQAEEALMRSERVLVAKDLMSKLEQSDREADLRTRKRELKDAENAMHQSRDAILIADRAVEESQTRVLTARKRLSDATITAPVTGYVTEVLVQASQNVSVGTQMFTVAPLDEYQLRVPIYNFNEFKRLDDGLDAYITIQGTEYKGSIDRLGAMTEKDRWGRMSNYAIVRFQGEGTLGLLGLNADVRMVLPPPDKKPGNGEKLMNALTGHGEDDLESRTASVTFPWMLLAVGKVFGCATFLVTFSLFMAVLFRNSLVAILGTIGLWHISNLAFDFAGLPDLSYLEMVRTMDKVLGGIASPGDEIQILGWLAAFTLGFAAMTLSIFISRDPQK